MLIAARSLQPILCQLARTAPPRSCGAYLDRLDDRWIVILRLVDARRDRPHPHRLRRERPHQVTRVRLVAQAAGVVGGCEDQGHAVVNLGDQLIGVRCDDREGAHPLAGGRVAPVFPQTSDPKRASVLHSNGIRLFGLLAFDRLPFEEAVHRQDAPPLTISLPERR